MAVAIRSKSTASFVSMGGTAYIDITKPTGLTAGDLMVACVGGEKTGSTPYFTAPAGWTLIAGLAGAHPSCGCACFWKIADSSDASASTFRFSENTGGTDGIGGIMYAITGHDTTNPISGYGSDNDSTSSTPTYTSGFTPTADNLLIAFFGNFSTGGGAPSASTMAIATSNPTWTEDLDQNRNGGGYYYHNACYSASRTQSTGTGNVTITYAGATSYYGGCILFGVQPPQSTNVTVSQGTPPSITASIPSYTVTAVRTVTISQGTPPSLVATIPAYTVTAIQNATISPAVQACTFTIPAYNGYTNDIIVSASVVTATFSIPAPTITAERYVTVSGSVVSATFSIPAYDASVGASVSPAVQACTFSIPSASVSGGATVSPSAQACTFSIPSYTTTGTISVTVSPSALSCTFSIPTYTVTNLRTVVVDVSPIILTIGIPTYVITGDKWQEKFAQPSTVWTDKF